jgi:hypothetical protein
MNSRPRYFLIGGIAVLTVVGLIGWHFWPRRGDILEPDGGAVVTVMDFGQSFPLDPLPSGWKHRRFWTRAPMTMAVGVKDGVPSMSKPMTARRCYFARSISISPLTRCLLGAGHRIADPQPARARFADNPGEAAVTPVQSVR